MLNPDAGNAPVTEIILTPENLGAGFSAENAKTIIINALLHNTSLRKIVIRHVPFPPEMVFEIHGLNILLNRTKNDETVLHSDLSDWYATKPPPCSEKDQFVLCLCWFLENWEYSEQYNLMFEKIHNALTQGTDANISTFKSFILKKLYVNNKKGQSIAYAIMQHTSTPLAKFLQYADPDEFVQHIQTLKLSEQLITNIIFQILLPVHQRADLAYYLAETKFATFINQYRTKALIANNIKDAAQAKEYLAQAIQHGSIASYSDLALLCPDLDDKINLLQQGANKGCLKSMIVLIYTFESRNMLLSSYQYVEMLDDKLSGSPALKSTIEDEAYEPIMQRNIFYGKLAIFIDKVFDHRLKRIEARCPAEHLPGLMKFKQALFKDELVARLRQTTWETLLTQVSPGLLKQFLNHQDPFPTLKNITLDAMDLEEQPNRGLLSMNPNEFAQALNETISQYYLAHLPLRKKTDEVCGTASYKLQ